MDVWDLHESDSEQSGPRPTLRSPTYSTAEIHRAEAHTERLVALRPVPVGGAGDPAQTDSTQPGSFQVRHQCTAAASYRAGISADTIGVSRCAVWTVV